MMLRALGWTALCACSGCVFFHEAAPSSGGGGGTLSAGGDGGSGAGAGATGATSSGGSGGAECPQTVSYGLSIAAVMGHTTATKAALSEVNGQVTLAGTSTVPLQIAQLPELVPPVGYEMSFLLVLDSQGEPKRAHSIGTPAGYFYAVNQIVPTADGGSAVALAAYPIIVIDDTEFPDEPPEGNQPWGLHPQARPSR